MILVTGADGYLGWPLLLKLSRHYPDERIIGVDHFGRRQWVEQIGSTSALPIASMEERLETAEKHGMTNISFMKGDLTNRDFVYQLLSVYRPRVILHAAAQPSAPYSHINGRTANDTQENNNRMCRHFLWGLKELDLEQTHFVETTTTGVYGAPNFTIPEGFLDVQTDSGNDTIPYPGMATSWYHMSKAHDVNNLYLAAKMWGLTVTDVRTAIVFGTHTAETRLDPKLNTRFDFDFYFGVVVNRFCAQALGGYPITVYGKGAQKKPMITLEDAVRSLVQTVELPSHQTFRVYNQMTMLVSPKDLAETVKQEGQQLGIDVEVKSLPNPRKENETHEMRMENSRFIADLLPQASETMANGIRQMLKDLQPHRSVFQSYRDRFMNA